KKLDEASAYLSVHDEKLKPVILRFGPCTIAPHTDYYNALVNSIISQQLSVKAAASITKRFIALFGDTLPAPEAIIKKSHDELRTAGLSNAKANYIRDLAEHIIDDRLRF